jgi:hypothetical protein
MACVGKIAGSGAALDKSVWTGTDERTSGQLANSPVKADVDYEGFPRTA